MITDRVKNMNFRKKIKYERNLWYVSYAIRLPIYEMHCVNLIICTFSVIEWILVKQEVVTFKYSQIYSIETVFSANEDKNRNKCRQNTLTYICIDNNNMHTDTNIRTNVACR